jgi:hypothetical protein
MALHDATMAARTVPGFDAVRTALTGCPAIAARASELLAAHGAREIRHHERYLIGEL